MVEKVDLRIALAKHRTPQDTWLYGRLVLTILITSRLRLATSLKSRNQAYTPSYKNDNAIEVPWKYTELTLAHQTIQKMRKYFLYRGTRYSQTSIN